MEFAFLEHIKTNIRSEKLIGDENQAHLKVTTEVRNLSKKEKRIRDLGKKATQLKKTDINESIKCLEMIQPLLDEVSITYPISMYLRLPLFLQQADRMDEAEEIFQYLYETRDDSRDRVVIKEKWDLAKKRETKKKLKN